MPFWNTQRVAAILKLPSTGAAVDITEITTDSRTVKSGSLFIAIKGDTMDGHDFISAAISKGAVAVITEKPVANPPVGICIFQVSSTMNAIRNLAHAYRSTFSIPFIGVVGSVGKTTTKELIAGILRGKYTYVLKTEGSQNGFLGIPLTLLRLSPQDEIAVIEIGIDEIGAMKQHLALVEPTHLIVTALGPEHLHQLKTVEIAVEEELKAFDYAVNDEKKMAINLADRWVKLWFQKNAPKLLDHQYLAYEKADEQFLNLYPSPLPGAHHEHNLLGAVTMGELLGLTEAEMQRGLKTFKTALGRTEIHTLPNGAVVIADYYNSNPTSLSAALHLLKSKSANYAVLGDMLELGDHEERFHRQVAQEIITMKLSAVLLYGSRMKWLHDELLKSGYSNSIHYGTPAEIAEELRKKLCAGDQVLIKGSRGMKMEIVFQLLQAMA